MTGAGVVCGVCDHSLPVPGGPIFEFEITLPNFAARNPFTPGPHPPLAISHVYRARLTREL